MVDVGRTDNLQNFLSSKTRFLGDTRSGAKILDTQFQIRLGQLFFKWWKVNVAEFSHAIFNFAPGTLTPARYNKLVSIRNFLSKRGITIVNDPSNIQCAWDKTYFFDLMDNAGCRIPQWKHIESPDDLSGWRFPFILRTNNDTGGKNCFLISDSNDLHQSYSKLQIARQNTKRHGESKIIAVEYIDSYDKRFDANVKYRVHLINHNIFTQLALPSKGWNITSKDYVSDRLIFSAANAHAAHITTMFADTFKRASYAVNIEFSAFDFLIDDQDNIIFLEAMPKFGIGNPEIYMQHEDPSITELFSRYVGSPLERNQRAFELLFTPH